MFGLIGKTLSHSFSRSYFEEKFKRLGLDCSYVNFEIEHINQFPDLLKNNDGLKGLNVTIPYKERIIPYVDRLSVSAESVGAVNTIEFVDGKLIGHNTDVLGFSESLTPLLESGHQRALILGTGGASKAIRFVLDQLKIEWQLVSRTPSEGQISYGEASELLGQIPLVINTTPLGTFPDVDQCPPLELNNAGSGHLFYDLIYNPAESLLLKQAREKGAKTKNGLEMLQIQAERAWEIWNEL